MYYNTYQNRFLEPNISWRKYFFPNAKDRSTNKRDTLIQLLENVNTHTYQKEQVDFIMEQDS